jgi:hypothetical protein
VPVNLGADVDEAAQESLDHGALSRAAADIDAATREKVRARVREVMARYVMPEIVALPGSFWLVGADG